METIFDHEPTKAELFHQLGQAPSREDYESVNRGQDTEFARIYSLYLQRGDRVKAESYLNRIVNQAYRVSVSMVDLVD